MRIVLIGCIFVASISCYSAEFDEDGFAQQQEVVRRVMNDAASYQLITHCGADSQTLKGVKKYLYDDIKRFSLSYPKAKVDIDGLFNFGLEQWAKDHTSTKANAEQCKNVLAEAKKYAAQ